MKVGINGIGIAGPTLAWWLKKYGHEPVLFEKAPAFRTGGYVIDFWGKGYDIAEKMGILVQLKEKGYDVSELRVVNEHGQKITGMDMKSAAHAIDNRILTISREDVAKTIFNACGNIESNFGTYIVGIKQHENGVTTELSDNSQQDFDIIVGADGLHSGIREITFGPEEKFEKHLGYYVAAFQLPHYEARDDHAYVMHTVPHKQVARFSMHKDQTLFLFTFKSGLLNKEPSSEGEEKQALHTVFGDMQWEVPHILDRMHEVENVYFDKISQIHMSRWTQGRVALIGDAAACASLLAGEGTGLAMIEAYILAGELHRSGGNYEQAFRNYEKKLQPFIAKKQKNALSFAEFFAPKNQLSLHVRNFGMKLLSRPLLADILVGKVLRDEIDLPDYEMEIS